MKKTQLVKINAFNKLPTGLYGSPYTKGRFEVVNYVPVSFRKLPRGRPLFPSRAETPCWQTSKRRKRFGKRPRLLRKHFQCVLDGEFARRSRPFHEYAKLRRPSVVSRRGAKTPTRTRILNHVFLLLVIKDGDTRRVITQVYRCSNDVTSRYS